MKPVKKEEKGELLDQLYNHIADAIKKIEIGGKKLDIDCGLCYTTSWVASKILKKMGYNCRPQKVTFLIGDSIAQSMLKDNPDVDKEEVIKAGGWAIGLGVMRTDKDLENNHWVVWFPKEEEIMDLTIGQANRPEKNINLKYFWEKAQEIPEPIFRANFQPNVVHPYQIKNTPELKEYFKEVIKSFKYKYQEDY